jgi:hypothetical protein
MKAFLLLLVFAGWFGIKHTAFAEEVKMKVKSGLVKHHSCTTALKAKNTCKLHEIKKQQQMIPYFETMLLPVMAL